MGCRSLKEIDLRTVEILGNSLFYYCKAPTEITIPESVTSIGADLFNSDSGIKKFYFESIENLQTIDNEAVKREIDDEDRERLKNPENAAGYLTAYAYVSDGRNY